MAKFCVIPGQSPVRLDSTDGHIIIIGETPREIPEQFVSRAKAAGCLTEGELADLAQRLAGGPAVTATPVSTQSPPSSSSTIDESDWPDPPPASPTVEATSDGERAEKIKAAVIEILNSGNTSELTDSGAPRVEALQDKLGFNVTASERDAAFEAAKG